jgi:hypothetical protein
MEVTGMNEAQRNECPSDEGAVLTDWLCDCFPQHCEKYEEHGLCWCEPDVIEIEGNKIFVHREEQ